MRTCPATSPALQLQHSSTPARPTPARWGCPPPSTSPPRASLPAPTPLYGASRAAGCLVPASVSPCSCPTPATAATATSRLISGTAHCQPRRSHGHGHGCGNGAHGGSNRPWTEPRWHARAVSALSNPVLDGCCPLFALSVRLVGLLPPFFPSTPQSPAIEPQRGVQQAGATGVADGQSQPAEHLPATSLQP